MLYKLSDTEQTILNLLWDSGQWMSGADFWNFFQNYGHPMKRQVINTYLKRMVEKGLLVKNGTKYIYVYTKQEFDQRQAIEILNSMYDGSLKKFVIAATGNAKLDCTETNELRAYLDSLGGNPS